MKIGYARVSTLDQNPELQLDALKQAGCERIFEERASGSKDDRKVLQEAIDYAREGDTLVVWKIDRLARSMLKAVLVLDVLEKKKIDFASLTEGIDTKQPYGRMLFQLTSMFAELERSNIRERTKAGLAIGRAQGRVGGRRPKLNEEQLKVAKAMLADPAFTVAEVARHLRVGTSTLYRYFPAPRLGVQDDA